MHPIAPSAWPLDPELTFLNHGSFGACPHEVLAAQQALRARIERQPVQFYVRELLDLIDAARERVAAFLGADPAGLVFVRNATSGVNAVLRSLNFNAGDEILVTDHGYAACEYAARFVAQRAGARVVVARLPFPGLTPDAVLDAVLDAVTPRTRLAMLDHITSPTGVVLPIARLIDALRARGVDTLVDGAHGPGMLPLDLNALGAAWYTANLHKWVCAPKGAAVLVVRPDHRAGLHPAVISHGHRFPLTPGGRSRLHWEFDWPGTDDPTPWLCAPVALDFFARQPGGWAAVQARGRKLALAGREAICAALGVEPPCPPEMIGTLAAIPLPDAPTDEPPPDSPLYTSPLQQYLLDKHRIEVPIVPWPAHPQRLVRFSAAPYNVLAEYERLTAALREAL
ncbi:MAG: aminotransferase class V-fold PLP-dependent enzyme [Myxococcales bacterium]|nr:aminotransferase class V-fold PLP-dependent enzyme [Myxococcales bacterium]